jgi:hypothetical protein|tara:strand:- start:4154 stop:4417 length:264 start_codon:yes stop_codon:yes gene_type:complete
MVEKEEPKVKAEIEEKELPSPRFSLVSKMFDEVDSMLAKFDASDNLTIFEMEILLMMLRKKVDHIGIVAAFSSNESEPKEADPNMYK